MFKNLGRILTVGLFLVLFLIPTPALAYTDQPDSTPTITQVHVNRNLIESGDVFVYGMYDIPYATPPETPASQTFIFTLTDSTNTNVYGFTTPFVYHDNGYGKGIVSFYLQPEAITWEQSLNIRIVEVSSQFETPVTTDVVVLSNKYTTLTTIADNQAEIAANIFEIGQTLENEFGKSLFTTNDGRNVLTDDGETYFRGAIPGLQSTAPFLFLIQQSVIDAGTRQYTTDNFDDYQSRFQNTWVGSAIEAGGEATGMTGASFMMFVFTLPMCLIAVIFTSMKFGKADPGFIVASVMMICAVLLGFMPTALFGAIFQIYAIYIGYIIFYSKSNGSLDNKLLSFSIFCWIASTLICVILEGSYFGSTENSIVNNLSLVRTFDLPIIGSVPVFNTNFIEAFVRILTWDYSFYTGSWAFLRVIWLILLTPGMIWGLVQVFINLIPSIIAILKPSIRVY